MAEQVTTDTGSTEDMASIAELREKLRHSLASSSLTVEQEIRIRSDVVDLLVQTFGQSGQHNYIPDAIQHLETILRRLPRDSLDRPKHLSTLSYVKMSEHLATHSKHALEEAVLNGRRAKEMATAVDLLRRNPDVYFRILTNFGYALAQRYALFQRTEDLEQAIECAREAYENAPKNSEPYYITLNNLASRLRMRYLRSQHADDINEALKLIDELRSNTAPGTPQHIMAAAQLGAIGSDKFKRTNKFEDLDEALGYCTSSLQGLPEGHEARVALLAEISSLYNARYQQTSEETDLRNLATYSGALFYCIPAGHARRGLYLSNYIRELHRLAVTSKSLQDIRSTIQKIMAIMNEMPSKYPEKRRCLDMLADLLIHQYGLSHDLRDFISCVSTITEVAHDYNYEADQDRSSKDSLQTAWLWNLRKSLGQLDDASPSNSMRHSAEKELPDMLRTCRQSQKSASAALEQFYAQHGLRLEVLVGAIAGGRTLSDDEIACETTKLKEKKMGDGREVRRRLKTNDYETELGLRKLAIDESGNIIMDLSGLMSDILGRDPTKTYSKEEFAAMTAQEEQKALDEARLKGRHPNLKLCRMCRDLTKVLQPTADGFELTAKKSWLPFGNFFQLRERKHCSVCSLILSVITMRSGELHPRLAAMDREVQGTRLSSGELSTNEKLIRFDYGLKHISELRVLTPHNYSKALRQAWEIDVQSTASIFDNCNSPIYDQSQQRINLDLVKFWLNDCDHNHSFACNHPRSGKRAEYEIPLILIDVVEECLVSISSDAKYFALSYVWGKVNMAMTLKRNYDERRQPRSLAPVRFPKTIRDAMDFVKSLQERYLWVDALCIVQDDENQKSRDIPRMDIVYGKAFATIVALEGTDADAGLPGVRAGTREPQNITALTVSNKSIELDDDPDSKDKDTIRLTATPLPLYLALELSRWNSRGWIVQEHLLSRRCLYFAPDTIYFQCSQATLSEGGVNEEFEALLLDDSPLEDNHILEKANRNNPLSGLDVIFDLTPYEQLNKSFNVYTKLVGTYSQRNLTLKSDILKGFAGMFAVLEENLQSTTFHGLPAAVISHAILWSPVARLPRRGAQLFSDLSSHKQASGPDPQFPSWSWVGWDGPVEYRLFQQSKGEIILPLPSVKVYNTVNGPISEKIQEERDIMEPLQQAADSTSNEVFPDSRDNQGVIASDKEESPEERVIAKMIPDRFRGSTWFVAAPEVPKTRNDPYIDAKLLRFSARTVALPAFKIMPDKEYLSSQSQVHIRSSQAVRRIQDRNGKHCGIWWEQAGYGYVGLGLSPEAEAKIDMLEISRYGDAYRRREGPSLVEGPISLFDDEVFPVVGPGSGLVNILVVDLDMGLPDGIGERCTVAVIHSMAWEATKPQEKEVRLV